VKINYIQENITLEMLKAGRDLATVELVISEVNAEMAANPKLDKVLPSSQAIQENLELVLYANRVPAVARLFQQFFELGIGILASHTNLVPTAEGTVNETLGYHLEDSVKRLLLACRAGEWVRWDVGKVFNFHGRSPWDEIIGRDFDPSISVPSQSDTKVSKSELIEQLGYKCPTCAHIGCHASTCPDDPAKFCEWTSWRDYENPGCYDTACGQTQYFSEENIKGNNYIYCPYCGKKILEIVPDELSYEEDIT